MIKDFLKPFFSQKALDQYGLLKDRVFQVKLVVAGIYFSFFEKTYKINGLEYHIPYHLTNYKFRGRFVYDTYEKEERTYLKEFLNPKASVLELGACIGVVSCLTNQLLQNKDRHVIVEANPNLIEWLEKNKTHNHSQFHIEHCVIDPASQVDFYIHRLIVGGSNLRQTPTKVSVPGRTIYDLQEKYNIQFDTLIMDIEGGELSLLRQEQQALKSFKQIFVELHPFKNMLTLKEAMECEEILTNLGFLKIKTDGNFQIWEK